MLTAGLARHEPFCHEITGDAGRLAIEGRGGLAAVARLEVAQKDDRDRRTGRTALIANLAYGQDPEGNERDGEVRLAAIARAGAGDRLHLGIDARWRFDLGSQTAKLQAANEPSYDLDAGPVAALVVGPVALVAHAGLSVVRRVGQDAAFGVVALAGMGTSF